MLLCSLKRKGTGVSSKNVGSNRDRGSIVEFKVGERAFFKGDLTGIVLEDGVSFFVWGIFGSDGACSDFTAVGGGVGTFVSSGWV